METDQRKTITAWAKELGISTNDLIIKLRQSGIDSISKPTDEVLESQIKTALSRLSAPTSASSEPTSSNPYPKKPILKSDSNRQARDAEDATTAHLSRLQIKAAFEEGQVVGQLSAVAHETGRQQGYAEVREALVRKQQSTADERLNQIISEFEGGDFFGGDASEKMAQVYHQATQQEPSQAASKVVTQLINDLLTPVKKSI